MVLVRLACAADLPTPDEALRRLASLPGAGSRPTRSVPSPSGPTPSGPSGAAPSGPSGAAPSGPSVSSSLRASLGARAAADRGVEPAQSRPPARPTRSAEARAETGRPSGPPGLDQRRPRRSIAGPGVQLRCLEDVVALAQARRDIQLKTALERDVQLVHFEDGRIEFALAPTASPQVAAHLTRRLAEWTGARWMVSVVSREAEPRASRNRPTSTRRPGGRRSRPIPWCAGCSTCFRAARSSACARCSSRARLFSAAVSRGDADRGRCRLCGRGRADRRPAGRRRSLNEGWVR